MRLGHIEPVSDGAKLQLVSEAMQHEDLKSGAIASAALGQACWYAAYTCARHEKRVAQQLAERGVTNFLPLYRAGRRWKDRKVYVELPLFPSYLFVQLQREERIRALSVPGLVRLVAAQGKLLPVPEREIELLRRALTEERRVEPCPFLRLGQRVRVRSGAMAGLEGYLVRKKDHCRIVVSIDLIMRAVALEIDGDEVEPAAPGSTSFQSVRGRV